MKAALGFLLALLTVEAALLIAWPAHFRAIIRETPDKMLRIAGVIEIILVVAVLVIVFRLI